jgi:CubicO group peptidase (beta-lactamase class C family)
MHDTTAADRRALHARRATHLASLFMFAALAASVEAEPAVYLTSRPLDEAALAGAVPAEAAAPASIDRLRARISEVLAREGVPGVGLALVDRDGLVWAGGVGVADRETGRLVDADTQFRVASITKSLVALGVMRLVEQGRLDLDQPLSTLMPEVAVTNAWDGTAPITLAHALEHTAGFDEMRFNEYYGPEGMSPRDALALNPRSRVARWRPGSRMSYANPGYTIAGHAIERATGEAWDTYLEREVLGPLGMPSARFRRTPEFADRLATGHVDRERAATFDSIAHTPAGSLLASPRELAALVRFMLVRGDDAAIVGPAAIDRIERTATFPLPPTDTNYGLGNYGDVAHRARARGHDGGLTGFLSCYRYFPELGVGYVMLLNGSHSVRAYAEIRGLLFAHLAHGRVLPAPPPAAPDREAIAAAAGHYEFANPRVEFTGFIERLLVGFDLRPAPDGAALELHIGDRAIALIPTGADGYRQPHESGASVRVTRETDGRRIVSAGWAYFEAGSLAWARARVLALQAALATILLAPLWAVGWALRAGVGRLRGRRLVPGELALHVWPAVAALLCLATPTLLLTVVERGAAATANPLSVALCLCTLGFAAASAAAIAEAVRAGALRALPLRARLVPSAAAVACFGVTLWLLVHGIIGVRTWAW